MKHLYFIRHGESVGNAQGLFSGHWDVALTDLGRNQAKTGAQSIKDLNIDCIVSSPLLRARQTADIIAEQIGYPLDKIKYSDLFMERNYGDLQHQPYSISDGLDFEKVPNIELIDDFKARAKQAADYLNQLKADNILVVGHGTHGRALLQAIKQLDQEIEVPIEQELPNAMAVRFI